MGFCLLAAGRLLIGIPVCLVKCLIGDGPI
jgi:hypothetical protein